MELENMHPIVSQIFDAFEQRGSARYGEESVTQLQHALQSGQLAMRAKADAKLITAALLHDIGHILDDGEQREDDGQNLDDKHETRGYQFLTEHFGAAIADPVRLHVVAKRYLCTKNPDYQKQLSPTSLKSFHDQGGVMSPEEIRQFEQEPFYREALQLRHWDDTAKDASAVTPPMEDFATFVEASLVG